MISNFASKKTKNFSKKKSEIPVINRKSVSLQCKNKKNIDSVFKRKNTNIFTDIGKFFRNNDNNTAINAVNGMLRCGTEFSLTERILGLIQ